MLWFKAATFFVHSRDNTAAQPRVIHLWRWGNLVIQHSSFLGGSRAFRMHISRSYPNQGIGCFFFFGLIKQAALPNPLETGISNSSRHSQYLRPTAWWAPGLTQPSGRSSWQVSVQPEPQWGLFTLFHAAAENLSLFVGPGHRGQVPRAHLEELKQTLSLHINTTCFKPIPLCLTAITRGIK